MPEVDAELLQTWAEALTDAANIIKSPAVTADHDQKLAEARRRVGGRDPDMDKTLGRPGTDVEVVASLIRYVAKQITEAERGFAR